MKADIVDCLVYHEVDRDRWADLERLFESPGGPKFCWCMVWRSMLRETRSDKQAKKAALEGRVQQGVPVGILGYFDGEPVAGCSIAPRDTYRSFVDKTGPVDEAGNVWSLACLFGPRRLRGQGAMKSLIAAATDHARENGATAVEAYPVDPDSPSHRFMGFVPSFEAAGFRETGRAGTRRHVMRLDL